jgi:uncharacterized protein
MQEEENVKALKDAFVAFRNGDMDALFSIYDDDAEYISVGSPDVIPWSGTYKGHEQIRQYFARLNDGIEFQSFIDQEYIAQGNKLAILGHGRYKVRSTGIEFETNPQYIVTMRDGKITKLILLDDTAKIASALKT